MRKSAILKDIIEMVNEKGESPLDVATAYGISKDTLRRRMKESGGFIIDNSTKKYHKDGKVAVASDYDGMEIELIRGKGNTRVKHTEVTPRKLALTFDDFTRDDAKKVRTIIDAWDELQERLAENEAAAVAAAKMKDFIPLQEKRMQLETEAPRTRRAYTISDDVWRKFDEISDGARIQKGEALEIALLDFIDKYSK
jgi:hypothetical protein